MTPNSELTRWGGDILASQGMAREKAFMQHGSISCYQHSLSVAETSVKLAHGLKLSVDMRALVRGALLHDYFLYDWHEADPSHKWHGFHHARRAMLTASRDFPLSPLEREIIARHMFPLNLTPPRHRESWIVCAADKWCALRETILMRKKR